MVDKTMIRSRQTRNVRSCDTRQNSRLLDASFNALACNELSLNHGLGTTELNRCVLSYDWIDQEAGYRSRKLPEWPERTAPSFPAAVHAFCRS